MEKVINLKMCQNRDIEICVDSALKHTINEDTREITAKQIYEIIDYSPKNKYVIQSTNDHQKDEKVLDFFISLFQGISDKVNSINESKDNSEIEQIDDDNEKSD